MSTLQKPEQFHYATLFILGANGIYQDKKMVLVYVCDEHIIEM